MSEGNNGMGTAISPRDRTYLHRSASQRSLLTWAAAALLFAVAAVGCTTLSVTPEESREADAYGVWRGSIPCADCPGTDIRLVLWRSPDFFRLTEVRRTEGGDDPQTSTTFGSWELESIGETPELGRFKLVNDEAQRTIYLERLPSGNVRLLDSDGQPQKPALDYILERTRANPES